MNSLSPADTAELIALLRDMRERVRRIGVEFLTALVESAPAVRGSTDRGQNELKLLLEHLKKLVDIEVRREAGRGHLWKCLTGIEAPCGECFWYRSPSVVSCVFEPCIG